MDPNGVPDRIKILRESLHMSQLSFGAAINTRPETISRWENGRTTPSLADMVLIADTFKKTLDWFAGVDETPQERMAQTSDRAVQMIQSMQTSLDQLLRDLATARLGVIKEAKLDTAGVGKKAAKKPSKPITVPREATS